MNINDFLLSKQGEDNKMRDNVMKLRDLIMEADLIVSSLLQRNQCKKEL